MTTMTHHGVSDVARTPAGEGFLVRFEGLIKTWAQRIRERDELAAMNERELRDIGITRTDVVAELDKPFWRA
ncbi:MAG TPA: DUF1127 domain-containing protein [Candidatus Cybelea sp.]|nr:DUF1127 domain-containing protein [Candidatus Cybelea sp.]